MRELTSMDHYSLAHEFKPLLGAHFQRIITIPGGYKLKFRKGTLLFLLPDKIYLTSYSVEGSRPDTLSQKVRKELSGLKLQDVRTLNLDRVMLFDFGERKLVLELFRGGNLILTDGEWMVIDLLVSGFWRDRELRRGVIYKTPPPPPISQGRILADSFLLRDLIRSGVPKPYALEIIQRMGIDPKTPTESVDAEEIKQILRMILTQLEKSSGYLCGEEPYPIPLSYLECKETERTFSGALDTFTPMLVRMSQKGQKGKRSKLEYMEDALKNIEGEIKDLEQALREIYEHWSELEEMFLTKNFRTVGRLRFMGKGGKYVTFEFTL